MEWNVRIERLSPGEVLTQPELKYSNFLGALAHGAAGGIDDHGWDVLLTVEAANAQAAINDAVTLTEHFGKAAELPLWPVIEISAIETAIADLRDGGFPDVVGVQEVIGMLGVTKQRLAQIRAAGQFPEPMVTLGATPVWLRAAVEAFIGTWNRKPGRPATTADKRIGQREDCVWFFFCPSHRVGEPVVRDFKTETEAVQFMEAHDKAVH